MKKIDKKNSLSIIIIVLIVGFLVYGIKMSSKSSLKKEIPTIYVPGTSGTVGSLDGYFEIAKIKQEDILKINIDEKNNVTELQKVKLKPSDIKNIVIAFSDAGEDIDSMVRQSSYLQSAFEYLENKYNISNVNFIGHSNGTVALTSYFTQVKPVKYFNINKIVAIAAPYNNISYANADDTKESDYLKAWKKNTNGIPRNVQLYNIYGNVNGENNDTIVTLATIKESEQLYPRNNIHYKEFKGNKSEAGHVELLFNKKVVKYAESLVRE
ncbi:alpha/beta hydrolase [Floricoccus penangensis]|uniref:alpha/beta hydrolase n=1 Tax=Floricoccus penangensis TaxID=1859475 RepID=UPI00203FEA0C|nr:alpha/beta hydrolase [Floricoccus penangensis]URZ88335.1 alpha/beta hydrolase [Floricoccus penangensis]